MTAAAAPEHAPRGGGAAAARPAAEVERELRRVEAAYDLLQYTIDGWCAWPLLRFAVAMELQNLPLAGRPSAGGLARRVADGVAAVPQLARLRRARYLVKTYTSGLAERVDGKFKDVWFDDLLLTLGDHLKLETVNNPAFVPRRALALVPSAATTAPFEVLAGVLARGGGPPGTAATATALATVLERELGVRNYPAPVIARYLRHFHWSRRIYRAVMARVRPAFVFTADPGEFAVVAAAREVGARAVELQHGFLDRLSHPSYGWTGYARPFKARMPIADRLFVYGAHWASELRANGFWDDEELRPVGSLRMEQYRRRRAERGPRERRTILFATQGLDVDATIAFLREFLAIARDADLELVIKLHPLYDPDPAPYLAALGDDPRVDVRAGIEGETTFELLVRADLHLSISSTVHYEAIGLGVPTVILPFATHEIMLPLHRAGHAELAATPAELAAIVRRSRDLAAPAGLSEYYFLSDALANMRRELGLAG